MQTPTSSLPHSPILPSDSTGIARAAQLISDGQLVLLPTETVYGIAVNLLSPAARNAAKKFKNGTAPNYVLHLASVDDLFTWVPTLPPIARRLITKSLPGPVAFQIKLAPTDLAAARKKLADAADEVITDGSLTLRVPDLSQTQKILSQISAPVAIIGAGTPSHPAIFELSDLPKNLVQTPNHGGTLDTSETTSGGTSGEVSTTFGGGFYAVDAGPTRYKKPSTLVRIDSEKGTFSVLRPGVIDERILQKFADYNILFLCSGNTCRSPMASAIAAAQYANTLGITASELPLRHILIQSAGLHAARGHRATREALEAVKPFAADLAAHISQPATVDLLRRADVIYTMTAAHRDEVLDLLPSAAAKTHRLDPVADVEDPIGAPLPVYRQVAQRLNELVHHRLSELRV